MRSRGKAKVLSILAVGLLAGLLGAQQAAAAPLTTGDVLAGTGNGKIKEFTQDGTLVQTLDTTTGSTYATGMCFDSGSSLYATLFNGGMSKFNSNGSLATATFGSGFNADPESCTVNGSDQIYVGQADGSADILKFDTAGNSLGSFDPATGNRGTDFVELGADQCTMLYNSESNTIKRFNVCTNTQLSDFATGLPNSLGCYALRFRSNGEVMVACSDQIHRLSSTGTIIQSYTNLSGFLFALNLDPDGTSFWTGDLNGGQVYKVDISTGNVLKTWNSSPETSLAGLAVVGELTAAQEGPPGDPSCSDGVDNDKDGLIDGADPGCQGGGPPPGCRMAGVGGYTDTFNPSLVVSKGDSLSSDTSKPIAPPNSSLPQKFHLAWGPTRDPKQHAFKMTKLTKATCIDTAGVDPGQGQTIDTFLAEGEGTLDGVPGFTFIARLIDRGEPGSGKDTVHVKINKKSDGSLVFSTKGTLSSGNQDSKDGQ